MTDKPGKKPEARLADEAIVSRAYGELGKTVPPADLDEKILAEARRTAADSNNVVIRVQRWRKWTMPVALAATVVFAVPLVVRVFELAPSEFDTDRSITVTATDPSDTETGFADEDAQLDGTARREIPGRSGNAVRPDTLHELIAPPRQSVAPAAPVLTPNVADASASRADRQAFSAEEQRREPDIVAAESEAVLRSPDSRAAGNNKASSAESTEEVFAAAPPEALADDANEYRYADPSEPIPAPKAELGLTSRGATRAAVSSERDRTESARAASPRSNTTMAAFDQAAGPSAVATDRGPDADFDRYRPGSVPEPRPWLSDIADLHRQGQIDTARRELGTFLTLYPDYALPDDYPLQPDDALFDGEAPAAGRIVPEAASWLRGIGLMAERGEIDLARTQLARFFRVYPDYPLPADFPLTRADALPIER